MPNIKEVIDEFCDRINQPRESSYVGNTTPGSRQYVSLFKYIAGLLLDQPGDWSQLKRAYSFTTSTGVANYQLPGDWLRLLTGTQWGITNQIPLAGPLSNAQLAFQTYGVNIATPFAGWQVNGAQGYIINTAPYTQTSAGYFQISPPGQDNTTQNVIAYTSCNYVWPKNWVENTAYSLGDKVTGINNIYICTQAGTSDLVRPSVTEGNETDGTVTWTVYHEPYEPSSDTDILILDKNLFVEGLRWAWYESKKQDFASIKRNWDMSVRTALGRQNGAMVISAAYDVNSTFEWPVVPQGGWNV